MLRIVFTLTLSLLLTACQQGSNAPASNSKPELLIYSGITMVRPLQQLATEFENQKGVKITIIQGASGFILKTLKNQQIGDIYFPGSTIFRSRPENQKIFDRYVLVGYNRLALIVPKDNPKHLNSDLNQLTDPELSIVLSSPGSSSVGKATETLLNKQNLKDRVFENVTYFTTDSHRLFKSIQNGDADLAVNWFATTKWPETESYMDAILIDQALAPKRSLELILLKYSKNKALALEFMAYASSVHGLETFARYGFLNEEELKTLSASPQQIKVLEPTK
ncbi:substrate-binding domain-containing protein [Thiomicrorhabdus sp. 6S3-12]|uniref:substrate-binding domain-containing protein n=1 Tax=Thiomicrorhabdus sp. 6S3-12 TaxID=2819681 RepID=UPI001AAD1BCA|nr:substrate-binding domain-containing protein [Thiomicrorhabdus sp. 6S3-12]MBO1922934.1 substrate-binding domain-containing protein [Thiomicrorhabdus sp. 6S3-12]